MMDLRVPALSRCFRGYFSAFFGRKALGPDTSAFFAAKPTEFNGMRILIRIN
jgi:hypothetical protein